MSTTIRCRSRVTSEKTVQHFGDKRHKFYLEERCSHVALEGRSTCSSCTIKFYTEKTRQYSHKFPHGTIDEPIPSCSHLFGGEWYEKGVKKWGEPPTHVVLCALRYQEEARRPDDSIASSSSSCPPCPSSSSAPSKVCDPTTCNPPVSRPRTMPRPKRVLVTPSAPAVAAVTAPSEKPVRRTTKKTASASASVSPPAPPSPSSPLAVAVAAATPPAPQEELPLSSDLPTEPPVPIKRTRRPRLSKTAADPLPPLSDDTKEEPEHAPPTAPILPVQPPKPPRKSAPRKRPPTPVPKKETVYDTLVHPLPVQHKDSCIPTHYEEEMEEKSLSDYETEMVPLTLFTLQGTTYFRDAKKNKIYRRIKEKTLGPYIGRYDPLSETLVTDVPDSDEEEE